MKILELFAGTRSVSKVFESCGHDVYTIEWDKSHPNIDWYADISKVNIDDILDRFGVPDVMWISCPCEKFSVAAIGKHWIKGTNLPKTEETKQALALLEHCVKLVKEMQEINPNLIYFFENPRGKMRKMDCMQDLPRYTVSYCQYMTDRPLEERRMKPTDLWTNHPDPKFKPLCKNGDPCHVAAPRGSRTGTQGMKNAKDRSVIPPLLCEHIKDICEDYFDNLSHYLK